MLGINQTKFALPQKNANNNQSQPQLKLKTLDKDTVSFGSLFSSLSNMFALPKSPEDAVIKAVKECIESKYSFNSAKVETIEAYADCLEPDNERINKFLREEANLKNVHPKNVDCLAVSLGKFEGWKDCVKTATRTL